jgi:hypothetical protein
MSTRTILAIAVFIVLVGGVITGDVLGLFDTPFDLGKETAAVERDRGPNLKSARSTCRFGAAVAAAGAQGRRIRPRRLAEAYVASLPKLSSDDRAALKAACLEGLRQGLRNPGPGS